MNLHQNLFEGTAPSLPFWAPRGIPGQNGSDVRKVLVKVMSIGSNTVGVRSWFMLSDENAIFRLQEQTVGLTTEEHIHCDPYQSFRTSLSSWAPRERLNVRLRCGSPASSACWICRTAAWTGCKTWVEMGGWLEYGTIIWRIMYDVLSHFISLTVIIS